MGRVAATPENILILEELVEGVGVEPASTTFNHPPLCLGLYSSEVPIVMDIIK